MLKSPHKLFLAACVFGTMVNAHAIVASPFAAQATVTETVTKQSATQYKYDFYITNTSTGFNSGSTTLTSFFLPYFPDEALSGAVLPTGLTSTILKTDYFGLGHGAETIQITGLNLAEGVKSGEFSYLSSYAPVEGPFGALIGGVTYRGDPPIPGSPDALAALPEPGSIALLGLGLLGFCVSRRKSAK